jgi:hypothetical protein
MASEHNGVWSQEGNADFKRYDTQSNQSARLNAFVYVFISNKKEKQSMS